MHRHPLQDPILAPIPATAVDAHATIAGHMDGVFTRAGIARRKLMDTKMQQQDLIPWGEVSQENSRVEKEEGQVALTI